VLNERLSCTSAKAGSYLRRIASRSHLAKGALAFLTIPPIGRGGKSVADIANYGARVIPHCAACFAHFNNYEGVRSPLAYVNITSASVVLRLYLVAPSCVGCRN
jgi:hypothetical protein